jgi:alkylhydroperoxidase family enzyme
MGLGRKAGLTDEQLNSLDDYEKSSAYKDVEKLVLRFADKWTRQGKAESATVAALSQKLSPTQLVVLAATVAQANWTNRFNETFDIQLP